MFFCAVSAGEIKTQTKEEYFTYTGNLKAPYVFEHKFAVSLVCIKPELGDNKLYQVIVRRRCYGGTVFGDGQHFDMAVFYTARGNASDSRQTCYMFVKGSRDYCVEVFEMDGKLASYCNTVRNLTAEGLDRDMRTNWSKKVGEWNDTTRAGFAGCIEPYSTGVEDSSRDTSDLLHSRRLLFSRNLTMGSTTRINELAYHKIRLELWISHEGDDQSP